MSRTKQRIPVRFLVLIIIAAVAISGCVGQTPAAREVVVVANDGLQINMFDADPTSVDVGDMTTFTLEVENVGGNLATDVTARLLGVEGQWRELRSGNPLVTSSIKEIGTLTPPNPTYREPGDFEMVTWAYKTPAIAPGLQYTAKVTAEILYDYNTTGVMVVKAIGDTFYRTEYVNKGRTPLGPDLTVSNAPVKILVPEAQADYYIRVKDADEDASSQYFNIQFKLANVGSGYPITDGTPGAVLGTISIDGPGNPIFSDCLGRTNTDTVTINTNTIGADLARLKTSQGVVTIPCTVKLTKSAFVLQDEQIRFNFNLGYKYYIQKEAQIMISSFA